VASDDEVVKALRAALQRNGRSTTNILLTDIEDAWTQHGLGQPGATVGTRAHLRVAVRYLRTLVTAADSLSFISEWALTNRDEQAVFVEDSGSRQDQSVSAAETPAIDGATVDRLRGTIVALEDHLSSSSDGEE
jgi:hypothetical protein